jgi:hypothetical protein
MSQGGRPDGRKQTLFIEDGKPAILIDRIAWWG